MDRSEETRVSNLAEKANEPVDPPVCTPCYAAVCQRVTRFANCDLAPQAISTDEKASGQRKLTKSSSHHGFRETFERLNEARKLLVWYHWFPFINLFFEFLLYSVPTIESVKEIMNALGLVDALLLGVVMAMPASVNHDELEEANFNFGAILPANSTFPWMKTWVNNAWLQGRDVGNQAWNDRRDDPSTPRYLHRFGSVSNRFAFTLAGASGALTCALLNVVLTYFFLSINKFNPIEDEDEADLVFETGAVDASLVKETDWTVWWQVAKWLIVAQFISTAVGVVMAFIALMILMEIKFPDDYCPASSGIFDARCEGKYFFHSTVSVLYGTLLGTMLMLSMAAAKRNVYLAGHAKSEKKKTVRLKPDDAVMTQLVDALVAELKAKMA